MGALDVDVSDWRDAVVKLRGAEKSVAASLRKRVRAAGKPLADAVVKDGPEGLPAGGGLADWLRLSKAGLSMTQTRLAITLSRGGKHDLGAINRGALRHPVWGNRRVWKLQAVAAGTYDAAFENHSVEALDEIEHVVDDVMEALQ